MDVVCVADCRGVPLAVLESVIDAVALTTVDCVGLVVLVPRKTLRVAFAVTDAVRDARPFDSVAVALCSRLDAVARALPDKAAVALGLALADAATNSDCVASAVCVALARLESDGHKLLDAETDTVLDPRADAVAGFVLVAVRLMSAVEDGLALTRGLSEGRDEGDGSKETVGEADADGDREGAPPVALARGVKVGDEPLEYDTLTSADTDGVE